MIDGISGVTSIAMGQAFVCAVRADAVVCWGASWANPDFPATCAKNTAHVGGGGSAAQWKYCPTPTVVNGVSGAVRVAAGSTNTCVVTKSHDVVCWKGNASSSTRPSVMSWSAPPADAGAPRP